MAECVENGDCQADGMSGSHVTEAPRRFCSTNPDQNQKKLVLHVDLNSTILVSDGVTAQGSVAALDYYLSTVTWGKMSKHGKFDSLFTATMWTEMPEFLLSHGLLLPSRGFNRILLWYI